MLETCGFGYQTYQLEERVVGYVCDEPMHAYVRRSSKTARVRHHFTPARTFLQNFRSKSRRVDDKSRVRGM